MRTFPFLLLFACPSGDPLELAEPQPIHGLDQDESWVMPGLTCDAEVVLTENGVPHIYGADRGDVARVSGFWMARDRYFVMDMARRLSRGEVSELLGRDALEVDMEARARGMTQIADDIAADLTDEHGLIFDAFAEGINAYIDAVAAGEADPPYEYETLYVLLGKEDPVELMEPFDRNDVAAALATFVYELGYETGDVGDALTDQSLPGTYDTGDAFYEERTAGAYADIWDRYRPVYLHSSSHGWGLDEDASYEALEESRDGRRRPPARVTRPRTTPVPADMLERLHVRNQRLETRLGHDWDKGFGSNAWAVAGTHTQDGRALLASDAHLGFSVPSLFYPLGLDTTVLGGGDINQVGVTIPGLPVLAVGTNGHVAWGGTQQMGDITDWYAEELQLDADGKPSASWFQGSWQPLVEIEESFTIAEVPLLGSTADEVTLSRWVTFDGRWVAEIEGRDASEDEVLEDGETLVNLGGDWVVPGDTDGDGVVSAITFDYVGFDGGSSLLRSIDGFGKSQDVYDYREASKGLFAWSLVMVAADSSGSILYSPYQVVPCRENLPRDANNRFAEGADPRYLLDGTTYGGFDLERDEEGKVVEDASAESACVVPFDDYPAAIDPESGYVVSANNDPGGFTLDDDLWNEEHYIGGPWMDGIRVHRMVTELERIAAAGATEADMQTLQGDHWSGTCDLYSEVLTDAIEAAQAADPDSEDPAEARLAALYVSDADAIDEVGARVTAWREAGCLATSGVETFYDPQTEQSIEDSIATAIHHAWLTRFFNGVFSDEGLPNVWPRPTSGTAKLRTLLLITQGRGADNPEDLASWVEETGESAFFDDLGTDEVETSEEVALAALLDALTYLRSEWGSDDMDDWLWGLRHTVHFDPILKELIGNDPTFSFLTEPFDITTEDHPLADDIGSDDPRAELDYFPKHGDAEAIDAANPGWSTTDHDVGSGSVYRFTHVMGETVDGSFSMPGGVSGLPESPYFSDMVPDWLATDSVPLRLSQEQVLEGAVFRAHFEALTPLGCTYD